MPRKIGFRVIHATSQDEDFKAVQLNIHSPYTKGWQSARFCLYPQEIVVQLDFKARIQKLQILSHQIFIATRIEFFSGDVPDGMSLTAQNARYKRLGYIELSNNEKTEFKLRELKSVHVEAIGSFVKLVIYKNHGNRHNIYNQVGLVAFNVIGDEIFHDSSGENFDVAQPMFPEINNKSDYISPTDDLAFDLYQDPEVAKIVRKLEKKKLQAVQDEQFENAKKLKMAIQELNQVGKKLSKFEVEKRKAVEEEDYDMAALKKAQMDECRKEVYNSLRLNDLITPERLNHSPLHQTSRAHSPNQILPLESKRRRPSMTPPRLRDVSNHPSPVPKDSNPPTYRGSYDDRILPAIAKKQNADLSDLGAATSRSAFNEPPLDNTNDNDGNVPRLPPFQEEDTTLNEDNAGQISQRDRKLAGEVVEAFGLPLATKAFSKTWQQRESALLEVHNEMQQLPPSSDKAQSMMHACIILINKSIRDKVSAVFTSGLHLLKMILTEYIHKHNIQRHDASYFLEQVTHPLLNKTGDSAQRQRDIAKKFVVDASQFPDVKKGTDQSFDDEDDDLWFGISEALSGVVSGRKPKPQRPLHVLIKACLEPVKPSVPSRLALSRAEIVESLYQIHGLNGDLTVENIMKFVNEALGHSSGEVRMKAETIIIDLYKDVGAPVREHLPPDEQKTRKNVQYKQIFVAFDKIDGKSNQSNTEKQPLTPKSPKPQPRQLENKDSKTKPQTNNMVQKSRETKPSRLPVRKDSDITNHKAAVVEKLDKTCIFCGEENDKFTNDGLDLHYWKTCPVLTRCPNCNVTVEVLELTSHLIDECKSRTNYNKCPRCTEAVKRQQFHLHIPQKSCSPAEPNKSRCPLCHKNIVAGEGNWKHHLLDFCRKNPRRTKVTFKQD